MVKIQGRGQYSGPLFLNLEGIIIAKDDKVPCCRRAGCHKPKGYFESVQFREQKLRFVTQ